VQAPPPIRTADGEEGFLNQGGITVTKTRFMVHGQTYALANITSVSAATIPASRGSAIVIILFGVLLILIGISIFIWGTPDGPAPGVFSLILGLIVMGLGVFDFKRMKDSYAVILNTAGSEMRTCISKDASFYFKGCYRSERSDCCSRLAKNASYWTLDQYSL
jgi:hypothetical protein